MYIGSLPSQDRMHLDCVFSIISDNCCIMLEDIMGAASPTRRLVDEYVRDPATKKYKLGRCVGALCVCGGVACRVNCLGALEVQRAAAPSLGDFSTPPSMESFVLIRPVHALLLRSGPTSSLASTSVTRGTRSSLSSTSTSLRMHAMCSTLEREGSSRSMHPRLVRSSSFPISG